MWANNVMGKVGDIVLVEGVRGSARFRVGQYEDTRQLVLEAADDPVKIRACIGHGGSVLPFNNRFSCTVIERFQPPSKPEPGQPELQQLALIPGLAAPGKARRRAHV